MKALIFTVGAGNNGILLVGFYVNPSNLGITIIAAYALPFYAKSIS
jgi:hypothetical protein